MQQQNLEYKPQVVINFHVDSCKWVDGTLVNKLMDIIKDDMLKYGNTFTPCPQHVSYQCFEVVTFAGFFLLHYFVLGTRIYEEHDF